MILGRTFLYLAIFFGVLSILSLISMEVKGIKRNYFRLLIPYSKVFIRVSTLCISLASAILIYYLLISDFSVHYVWQYTSKDLPFIYKISAFWTGEQGSLMFLSWFIFIMALWFSEHHGHETGFHREIQIIVLLVGTIFLYIDAVLLPFQSSIEAGLPEVPEDGAGLNPLLVNKWMIFHPPGIFIPYGILTVIFATAVVHFFDKNEEWERSLRPYSRISWIILGAGIVTGVMWSYEVWEGYWIWDPAFTSILMTWLLLTAFLHAASMYRKGKMKMLAPALAVNTFIFAMYSIYIIRSGTIQSAHVFGEGVQTLPLLVYVVLLSLISEGLILYHYFSWKKEIESAESLLSTNNTFYAAIIFLAALSFVLFWGLSSSMILQYFGGTISIDLYGSWSYPITLALIGVLGICMLESLGRHWTKGIIFGALLVLAFFMLKPTHSAYTNLSASILTFAGIGSVYQIIKNIKKGSLGSKLRSIGPHVVHLGIVVMLTGVLLSTYATSETVLFMKFGEKKTVGGYEIQLADLAFPVEHKHATAVMTKIGSYNIYKEGVSVSSGTASFRTIKGEFITEPLIYRGLLADVNVRYQGIGTESPIFISVANVKVIPGMTILWIGAILVIIGCIPLCMTRYR